jgi:hypothetical protein
MSFDAQLARGRVREADWRAHLADARGMHVVDVAKPSDDDGRGGPRVRVSGGYIVAPDVLAIDRGGRARWYEVKTKSVPGYRYRGQHRGWEHGVDLRHWRHYLQLAERAPVYLVTCEEMTPPSLDFEPPAPPKGQDGKPDWLDYRNHLVDGPVWRAISADDAARVGRTQVPWCRGGGWLWPLSAMTVVHVEAAPAAPRDRAERELRALTRGAE